MNKLNCLQHSVKGLSTYIHLIGGQKENSLHIIMYKQGRIQKELKGVLCRISPPPSLVLIQRKCKTNICTNLQFQDCTLTFFKCHQISFDTVESCEIWITFFDYKTVWCFNPVFIRIIILLLVCQVNQHIYLIKLITVNTLKCQKIKLKVSRINRNRNI